MTNSQNVSPDDVAALRQAVRGPVFARGDAGLAEEVSAFNTMLKHQPDVVVGVTSDDDVAVALRFAREHRLPVRIHATGHGAFTAAESGLIISTKRLDTLEIDPKSRLATIGAGLRWRTVIDAAAEHGLAPITGSSVDVGVVGYTLGGGLGPLARSHGVTSDWVRAFRVVTAEGEAITVDTDSHAELFWALRGGKVGLGVVTALTLELVPLDTLYAGALLFDGPENIEAALRAWAAWLPTAPDDVTTSVALMRMPPADFLPEPLRGRNLLALRFAYPGDAAEGERLLAPLRHAAPVYMDTVDAISPTLVHTIHNDPSEGGPDWSFGAMLSSIDDEAIRQVLTHLGPTSQSPFLAAELRQLGGAVSRDVAGGSAVGGRNAGFTLSMIAVNPETFASAAPQTASIVVQALEPWLAPVTNINFAGNPALSTTLESAWDEPTRVRLGAVRRTYDPDGVLA
jgi:UDP-N-acetylenolpyruvoylglucosamine reductase